MASPVSAAFYAAPPNQVPNIFAAFWSNFMQVRNPWAQELFFQRLAEDPEGERQAQIAELLKIRGAQQEENGRQARAMLQAETQQMGNAVKVYQSDNTLRGIQTTTEGGIVKAQLDLDAARLKDQNLSTESVQNSANKFFVALKEGMAALERAGDDTHARAAAFGQLAKAGTDAQDNINSHNDRAIVAKQAQQIMQGAGLRLDPKDINRAQRSLGLGEPKPEFRPRERGLKDVEESQSGTSKLARDVLGKGFRGQTAAPADSQPSPAATEGSATSTTTREVTPTTPSGATPEAPAPSPVAAEGVAQPRAMTVGTPLIDELIQERRDAPITSRLVRNEAVGKTLQTRPGKDVTLEGFDLPSGPGEAADQLLALQTLEEGGTPEEGLAAIEEQREQRDRPRGKDLVPKGRDMDFKQTLKKTGEVISREKTPPDTSGTNAAEEAFAELAAGGADMDPERRAVLQGIIDRESALDQFKSGTALADVQLSPEQGTRKEGRELLQEPETAEEAAEMLVNGRDADLDDEDDREKKKKDKLAKAP